MGALEDNPLGVFILSNLFSSFIFRLVCSSRVVPCRVTGTLPLRDKGPFKLLDVSPFGEVIPSRIFSRKLGIIGCSLLGEVILSGNS